MGLISLIKNSAISGKIRTLSYLGFGKMSASANEYMPYGVDSSPITNTKAAVMDTSSSNVKAIVGYLNKQQKAQPGEMRTYATDSNGNVVTQIWQHTDGTIELGGNGDAGSNTNHAAQYEGLQTAFNQLKNDFNGLVAKFNAHVHSGVQTGGGTSGTPTVSGASSSADITGAKLNNIKTQ